MNRQITVSYGDLLFGWIAFTIIQVVVAAIWGDPMELPMHASWTVGWVLVYVAWSGRRVGCSA